MKQLNSSSSTKFLLSLLATVSITACGKQGFEPSALSGRASGFVTTGTDERLPDDETNEVVDESKGDQDSPMGSIFVTPNFSAAQKSAILQKYEYVDTTR